MGHLAIYSDKSILKCDYNYGFEIFNFFNICPKNTLKIRPMRLKVKPENGSNPRPMDY